MDARSLPRVDRPLTFDEQRFVRVYRLAARAEWQGAGGVTKRQVGMLLGLAHDGSALAKLLDTMEARGWLTSTRDVATQFAPRRWRARWDADTWAWHLAHYDREG